MKKFLFTLSIFLMSNVIAIASSAVTFVVRNGIDNPTLKANIESQATKLLEMLNEAQEAGKNTLNFNGLRINDEARQTILLIWKYQHMHVWLDEGEEEAYIEETVLTMRGNQYQVRNIPMRMQTVKGEAKKEYNEVSINFDRNGYIVDFNITMSKQQYGEILKNAIDVEDEYNRKMLAHWMDQLQTAYNMRDMSFFEAVFSEDALIITGKRKMVRQQTDARLKDQAAFEYNVSTKREYLTKLSKIFDPKVNPQINILFTDKKYRRHGGNPRYYMVDCTQHWNTTRYSDVGHLFVIWDFKDPENPQILVRVWQHPDDTKKYTAKDFVLPN